MAPRHPFDLESLSTSIPGIFDQAQTSAATHKKNCVALYLLQVASADVVESVTRGRDAEVKLVGERAFSEIFLGMLNRVLIVKKSTPAADRIVKFVAAYVKFLNEKVSDSDEEETSSSRFVARLLKYFLKGFQAKSKEVRFRCLNFVSEVITSLGELDQDLYAELRAALLERLADKEPLVRVHSVFALSLLAASEDPYELDDDEPPIINSLLEALFYDTAAEVRRAALVQLPFSPTTLPALLTRMRDIDALTRKLVFTVVLPRLTNPRQLTIMQREQVVSHGLGDRTEAVRVATARLLGTWVDACEGDLGAFVALFDVQTPDIARDALKSVFITRAEAANELEFDDMFWENLKPETALLARTFVEYCMDKKDESRLEATLPVMTALAFLLQASYNTYLELMQEEDRGSNRDKDANDAREEQVANAEFVMGELLRLAVHLDYTDEIGRRKMFGVVRNMLAHPELPEALIEHCVDVLRIMSPNERDLIRVVVEVINELRDTEESMAVDDELNDADSTVATAHPGGFGSRSQSLRNAAEMTPEEKLEADLTDLRCLNLCIAVLGHIHGTFDENSTLRGVLEELIVPSVQRKELALREKGLVSLGLCCLISKNMALSSFQLFLSQVKSSPESLRIKVLQVVFDIMMTYEKDLFGGGESIGERVITFLMQVLEAEESITVQSLMCLGLAKLMLFGLVTDERILMSLIFAYVSPTNADNQELRQCLAYFLPVYCYSSLANQMRLQSVFVKTLDLIFQTYEELENDQDMISPLQFGQLLVDWTDPSKIVGANEQQDFSSVHVHLAIDIVRALYDNERAVEERKTLCNLLGKLVFPREVDEHLLYALYILVVNLTELCPFDDTSTDKAFLRFKSRIEKHFVHALAEYDEQACFHDSMGTYNEVFEFLGVTHPKQRHFEGKISTDTTSKRGRAHKVDDVSAEEDSTVAEEEPSRRGRESRNARPKAKPKASRQREASASTSEENEEQATDTEQSKSTRSVKVAPRSGRARGKEAAKSKSAATTSNDDEPIGESQSDAPSEATREGEEEEQSRLIPSTPPRKKGTKRLHTPTKSPTMASPMPKRQNRGRATGRLQTTRTDGASRASNDAATQPVKNVRTGRGKSKSTTRGSEPTPTRGRGGRRPPPSLRAADSSSEEGGVANPLHTATEEEEDSDVPSDESVPQRRGQGTSRPAPRVMEEKIGWDDGSDF